MLCFLFCGGLQLITLGRLQSKLLLFNNILTLSFSNWGVMTVHPEALSLWPLKGHDDNVFPWIIPPPRTKGLSLPSVCSGLLTVPPRSPLHGSLRLIKIFFKLWPILGLWLWSQKWIMNVICTFYKSQELCRGLIGAHSMPRKPAQPIPPQSVNSI